MFDLDFPTDPYWLDLPGNVRVKVRPLTYEVAAAAQSHANRTLARLREEHDARTADGAPTDDLPDITNEDVRAGLVAQIMAGGLARFGIIAWEGIAWRGGPADITPETLERFARAFGGSFVQAYDRPLERLADEGNASATAPAGSSGPAANTAEAAPPATSAAPPSAQA